ncbi:MAG: 7-carboxy-7-deazaguanine synthase QueE [Candidatus Methanoperedens sp.]
MQSAHVSEIFNSIQGEGPYVGVRQVFLRFQECQLHCAYCDTPDTRTFSDSCRIEKEAGTCDFIKVNNPLSRDYVQKAIRKLWTPSTKHIALTGGEPLIHVGFIRELETGYPLYLETNSGFPEKARELGNIIDIASCDIKLPEHEATDHYHELLEKELETISIFRETSETFVKIIILPETTIRSISPAVEGIASIDREIMLVLQPVTASGDKKGVPPAVITGLMDFAGKKLKDVRVIPQTHKLVGLL